ncbi:FAD-dependent oxidoreductase [Methylomonas sp. UP202]|uniref:NAD(P)/FAD-dependent oxidoreductase n=1 Tax=Methylomonas sp. UP202 TaxID=3040943 RepID=UPI0024788364|nr:FAD-dependent oxidoreductase [Methylomonas sp. UP202]WGS87464.1 FAD-dependent oxidoreductase [Methylomonas sp. UP202]
MKIDVLIVGQGLAGSLLAWTLLRRRLRVVLVDDGRESASKVAAGLINPITGRRWVKAAYLSQMLPAAMSCYQALANHFGQAFFVEMPMLRLLRDERDRQRVIARLEDPIYEGFLTFDATLPVGLRSPFGAVLQTSTGFLRTEALLARIREALLAMGVYRTAELDCRQIALEPELRWRELAPRRIVFCEGHRARFNPWFGGLPFQPAKGEILTGVTTGSLPEIMLNYRQWLVPLGDGGFKTGATYDTTQLDAVPTEAGKQELLADLRAVYPASVDIRIEQHRAGIRPTTLDKQPFLGCHPRHRNLYIFNGFGSKGSLTIPWLAERFADFLQQRADLPAWCDVSRYHDSHFPG